MAVTLARRWASRIDGWLTPDRLVVYPVVITVLFVVVWTISLRTALPLPDFMARWTAGRMVADGQVAQLYDPAAQSLVQARQGATALSWFVSPPPVALAFVPFGLLPYGVGAVLWTAVSVSLIVWSLRALSRFDPAFAALRRPRRGAGRRLQPARARGRRRRAGLGGGPGGAGRGGGAARARATSQRAWCWQWRSSSPSWRSSCRSSCCSATHGARSPPWPWPGLAVAGVATAVLGVRPWLDWLDVLSTPLYADEVVHAQAWKTSTLKGLVDSVGAGAPSVLLTLCWLAAALVVLYLTARRVGLRPSVPAPLLLLTLAPVVTVLVTPHAIVYDLVVLLPGAVWLVHRAGSAQARSVVALAYVLLFLAPLLHSRRRARRGRFRWSARPGWCWRSSAPGG